MLLLTVKEGDYLMIGDDIRIQFIEEMSGKCLRIGIDAPKSLRVSRSKLYEKSLLDEAEKNSSKLEEIELQKQAQIMASQKRQEKRRVKALEKQKRKLQANMEAEYPYEEQSFLNC